MRLFRMTGIRPAKANECQYYRPRFIEALMKYATFGSNRRDREKFVVEQARSAGLIHAVSGLQPLVDSVLILRPVFFKECACFERVD